MVVVWEAASYSIGGFSFYLTSSMMRVMVPGGSKFQQQQLRKLGIIMFAT